MSIYKGQSAFDITLDTGTDLSTASAVSIHYQKPGGIDGTWSGNVVETTKIQYAVEIGDIDESGAWRLQSVATFPGGRVAYGDVVIMRVFDRLTIL